VKAWILFFALASTTAGGVAFAKDCPEDIPVSLKSRRALAKEWFSEGQAAQTRGDEVTAAKAFACSWRMVQHAFTAYNLARSAEKTGDLEQARQAYHNYLTLAPQAEERAEVETKIKALDRRIAKLEEPPEPKPSSSPLAAPVSSAPAAPPANVGARTAAPATPPPAGTITTGPAERGSRRHTVAAAVLLGSSVVALAGAIVLNLMARQKMSDCRGLWAANMQSQSDAACDSARPLAYGSYSLFGAAAATAVVGGALFLWQPRLSETVGLALIPGGGAALSASGRF
jgi:hypothetical protein